MKTMTAGYLVIYGIFVIFLGVIGYLTHPEKAATALIFGGGFGALTVLWGILGAKGVRWSRSAALLTATLLGVASVWRASLGWMAIANGQTEKLFAAIVITLMLIVSLLMFGLLIKVRQSSESQPPKPGEL